MRMTLALLGATALAACQRGPNEDLSNSGEPPAASEPGTASTVTPTPSPPENANAPASLVGEYRVAGIDGAEVGGGIGIGLSITEREIYFEPRCAGFNWSYTYKDGDLSTDRPVRRGASSTAGPQPPVCLVAIHVEQARLATALDAVTQAERTPSNGIELTGGGHSVTLYSQ
jgi:hypothetical protein